MIICIFLHCWGSGEREGAWVEGSQFSGQLIMLKTKIVITS